MGSLSPIDATEMIFEPFGHAANADQCGLPGAGLGPCICHSTLERSCGRIWAESAGEMQGTTLHGCCPGPLP